MSDKSWLEKMENIIGPKPDIDCYINPVEYYQLLAEWERKAKELISKELDTKINSYDTAIEMLKKRIISIAIERDKETTRAERLKKEFFIYVYHDNSNRMTEQEVKEFIESIDKGNDK